MSINSRIEKMWYIYTKEHYSAIKKNEIMPLEATWMVLEIVRLHEVSQTEKEISYDIPYMWNLKKKWTYLQNRKRLADLGTKFVAGGKSGGKRRSGSLGCNAYTAAFDIDSQQGPTYSSGNSALSYGRLDGRGAWERMDTCVSMAESLCRSPETVTTLLRSYIPIQNKKFKKIC